MSKSTQKNKEADLAKLLVAGIGKHYTNAAALMFGSASITPAELTKRLQTLVDLRAAVNDAKATTKAKLADEDAQAPALLGLMTEFVSFAKVSFSKSPDVLADFGLALRKARTPLTVAKKAAAAAKSAATRATRHTMGKRQKQSVKGNVVDVVLTPVTAAPPIGKGSFAGAATPAPTPMPMPMQGNGNGNAAGGTTAGPAPHPGST